MPTANRMLAVMLMVTLVTLALQPTVRAECMPTSTKPDLNSIQVKNVASEYKGVVVNLAGYLELFKPSGNSSYLPLDIDTVTVSALDVLGYRHITMSGECFVFDIGYFIGAGKPSSNYTYDFFGIDHMLVQNDANMDPEPKKICNFDQMFDLKLPNDRRYSCKEALSHKCSANFTHPVGSLVLKSFEIEIEGSPANVKKGLFTKSPLEDSCKHWNK